MRLLLVVLFLAASLGLFVWQLGPAAGLEEGSLAPSPAAAPAASETLAMPVSKGTPGRADLDPGRAVPSHAPSQREAAATRVEATERAASIRLELVVSRYGGTNAQSKAGRHVEIEQVGAGGGWILAEGTTGADGRFQAECRLSFPAGEDPPRLRARVLEPGYSEIWGRLSTKDGGASYSGRVSVQAGRTLRGRVVDAEGQPAPGRVSLYRLDRDSGKVLLNLGGRATSKDDGSFTYHAQVRAFESRDDGGQLVLLARAPDLGTSALVDFESAKPEALQAIEIVVRGPGEIRGRLTDAAGEAVPGAKLKVTSLFLEAMVQGGGQGEGAGEGAGKGQGKGRLGGSLANWVLGVGPQLREMEGEGFEMLETVTDSGGGFRVAGLRPGEYLIHTTSDLEAAAWSSKGASVRTRLTPEPVRAGTADEPAPPLSLTLERRQVVVTLLQADGSPWTEPVEFADSWGTLTMGSVGEWSLRPSVTVTELPGGAARFGRAVGEGRYAFAVGDAKAEAEWVKVSVMGGQVGGEGFVPEVRTLGANGDQGTIHAEFRAVPRARGGRLRLTGTVVERSLDFSFALPVAGEKAVVAVADPIFGRPIPTAKVEPVQDKLFLASHDLEIVDLESGEVVHSSHMVFVDDEGMALPTGRYRVSVRPSVQSERFMAPRSGGATAEVSIGDSEVVTAHLDVDAGSTVRPYLDFAGSDTRTSVWLEDSTGHRTSLTRPEGAHNTWVWPQRRAHQSNIVPSGSFTLHAETETQHVSVSVTLKPRECLDVILR